MPKRKVDDDEDDEVTTTVTVKKHSLDSDEEDPDADSKKYEIMDEEEIEGQEDATIEFDGDIRITPFNMKEELEEGHFDKDGNYFLKKDKDVRDVWLDNIDWVKIAAKEKPKAGGDDGGDSDSSDDSTDASKFDHVETFKRMVTFLKPGETILQAIKRLGKKGVSQSNASSRWKTKNRNRRVADQEKVDIDDDDGDDDSKKMLELTELADALVHRGWMEIYQETFEKLSHRIKVRENASKRVNLDDDDALDMFADNFDEKAKESTSVSVSRSDEQPSSSQENANENSNAAAEIQWQFKWENADDAKIYGPHTSHEMSRWESDGYFKDGVWVRRVDQPEAQFYTSKRIDFDLYV